MCLRAAEDVIAVTSIEAVLVVQRAGEAGVHPQVPVALVKPGKAWHGRPIYSMGAVASQKRKLQTHGGGDPAPTVTLAAKRKVLEIVARHGGHQQLQQVLLGGDQVRQRLSG